MNPEMKEYEHKVSKTVSHYKLMSEKTPSSSMLREVMWQYTNMANGGDGGTLGYWPEDYAKQAVNNFRPVSEPTCRSYNYPGYPDTFFQDVCTAMEWEW